MSRGAAQAACEHVCAHGVRRIVLLIYQARHVWREMNSPCPWPFRHVTPLTRDQQVNAACCQFFPYDNVT